MFPGPPLLSPMSSKPNCSLLRSGCLLSSKGRRASTRAWSISLSCCNSFALSSGGCIYIISSLHLVVSDSHCLNLFQAGAAIHEKFPDSPLFSRMSIFKSSQASEFISQWPHARKEVEARFQVDTEIAANFKEVATQSAFLSLSTSQRELSEAVKLSHSLLEVLARQTEPLSPSRSVKTHVAVVRSCSATPSPTKPCSNFPSLQPPSMETMVAGVGAPLQAVTAASPSQISPTSPMLKSQKRILPPPILDPELLSAHSQGVASRYVVSVNHKGSKYHVLRLSPGPLAPPTPFDIILPPAAAFVSDQTTVTGYPSFSASSCGWQALFSLVIHPDFLWDCWGPGNLGEFSDVSSLWKCWDEGAAIEGVGRKPPLRMVETEWGCRKDKRSNKGHHAAWRPRQNTTVCLCSHCSPLNATLICLFRPDKNGLNFSFLSVG